MKALLIFFYLLGFSASSQGLNNLWMLGHSNQGVPGGIPYGGTDVNFQTGSAVVSYEPRVMNFSRTAANITNTEGDLLFSTNGIFIADRTEEQMLNGDSLNPGPWSQNQAISGLAIFQAALIIPKPGDTAVYYLFHNTLDEPNYNSATQLYLTTIDMRLNGGLGAVTTKNQPVITDELAVGKITAVKHANGRDWWVVIYKTNSSIFYRLLITPNGVSSPLQQHIGNIRTLAGGQVAFSPDGSRYAYYFPSYGLDLMEFDRCIGIFSNPLHVNVNDSTWDGGVAFSANSHVLYVASSLYLYQFDLTASDINASRQTVGIYDGWHEPGQPVLQTKLEKALLAPDGKIYISTGNGTRFLHVIHNPNGLGSACNFAQRGLELPTYYFNSLPNHPNYHLGALAGSPCDTLLAAADQIKQVLVQLYPNPNSGEFSLSYAPQPEQGQLLIYDVLGKLVHQEPITQWSQVKRVNLPQLPQGVYHSRLVWKGKAGVTRFVKE